MEGGIGFLDHTQINDEMFDNLNKMLLDVPVNRIVNSTYQNLLGKWNFADVLSYKTWRNHN